MSVTLLRMATAMMAARGTNMAFVPAGRIVSTAAFELMRLRHCHRSFLHPNCLHTHLLYPARSRSSHPWPRRLLGLTRMLAY